MKHAKEERARPPSADHKKDTKPKMDTRDKRPVSLSIPVASSRISSSSSSSSSIFLTSGGDSTFGVMSSLKKDTLVCRAPAAALAGGSSPAYPPLRPPSRDVTPTAPTAMTDRTPPAVVGRCGPAI